MSSETKTKSEDQDQDKLKIWAEIKKRAPVIIKEGGNPVALLLWSYGKTFGVNIE